MNRDHLSSHAHAAPSRRIGRLAAAACAVTAGLGLSACVAPPELPPLRVAPNYRLEHAGSGLAKGYALLAQRYEGEARWHEALQAWIKAVQAAPSDADLRNALGQAQARLGDHNAAVETLHRAVQLAPDQAGLHNNLGYALMRAGREQEARTALLQALALQPGYVRAQANLRRLEDAAVAHQAPAPAALPAPLMAQVNVPGVANVGTGTTEASRPAKQAPDSPAASPVSPASPGAVAAPAALPAPAPAPAPAVEIANGNGVEGMAACMAEALRSRGAVGKTRLRNALPYDTATTVVRYRASHAQMAQALARQLPGGAPAVAGLDRADSLDLRIVLGHDLRTSGPCARPG